MDNFDNIDLIDQYLSGSLSPEERQVFEGRMASDEVFRSEVALHRHLLEEFSDPQKLQLRDVLTDILRAPPPAKKYGWSIGPIVAVLALLLGVLGWYWVSSVPASIQPASQEEIKSVPPINEPIAAPEKGDAPSEPVEKTSSPIAHADPAAYIANAEFERRLGSMNRASDGMVKMTSPAMGATFKAENGVVKINFRGTAPAEGDTARFPLVLKVYDNKVDFGKSLYRVFPTIMNRNAADGQWSFETGQRFRLRPGLYYFTVERKFDEDLIFAGKFKVE
ncbi:MAG: hypothetical protein Q7T20_04055 [Saprospiraceae bacterium]|nr:hypothetical protein [Saprospiraceae bacterium]